MRKLLWALAIAASTLGAPAAADEGWSEFAPVGRGHDRAYIYFVPGDYGRIDRSSSWDDGYFAQGGGVRATRNHATFDYDRDYPYDYPSYSLVEEEEEFDLRAPSCTTHRVRDGKSGWSDVRVCRN